MKAFRYNRILFALAAGMLFVLFKVMPQQPGIERPSDGVATGADSASPDAPIGAGNGFGNGASY